VKPKSPAEPTQTRTILSLTWLMLKQYLAKTLKLLRTEAGKGRLDIKIIFTQQTK
jgi:hypothetical protein